ncbi:hypothetical protein WL524_03840 [Staphylococcus pasteuri]
MQTCKEMINKIEVKYIDCPQKLESCVIGNTLYINKSIIPDLTINEPITSYGKRKSYKTSYLSSNGILELIPLNLLIDAIESPHLKSFSNLAIHFDTTSIFIKQNITFYKIKYPNLKHFDKITD